MTRDKEEKLLREALIRQRAAEIMELALSDPLYGVSREEAVSRTAEKLAEMYPAGTILQRTFLKALFGVT